METVESADHVIVGAGAGGLTAAALFARRRAGKAGAGGPGRTILVDAHAGPGGQAGWFARGFPRRLHDAGATQLVDCGPGGLHETLFRYLGADAPALDRIPSLTHHFPGSGVSVTLRDDGGVSFLDPERGVRTGVDARGVATVSEGAPDPSVIEDLGVLARILASCAREADWMWEVFHAIPRFPWQAPSDLVRALRLAAATPPSRVPLFPLFLAAGFGTACRAMGFRDEHAYTRAILEGLLLDTTQNTIDDSPFLAGLMGVAIMRRGLFRARGGMRALFRPLLSKAREDGLVSRWNTRVRSLSPTPGGWLVRSDTGTTLLARHGVVCNLTIWDAVALIAGNGQFGGRLESSSVFRRWREIARKEDGWGAFSVYAVLPDSPSLPDHPWYHQVFARTEDEGTLAGKANYVSIAGRGDPANPPGGRVLTTTLHVPAGPLDAIAREATARAVVMRTEKALGVALTHVETAVPSTYERYTGRAYGRVGGFRMSRGRFLFNAPPSLLRVEGVPAPLVLAGDTVFPGQGVIACMLSGVNAWERVSGADFLREVRRAGAPSGPVRPSALAGTGDGDGPRS